MADLVLAADDILDEEESWTRVGEPDSLSDGDDETYVVSGDFRWFSSDPLEFRWDARAVSGATLRLRARMAPSEAFSANPFVRVQFILVVNENVFEIAEEWFQLDDEYADITVEVPSVLHGQDIIVRIEGLND